MQKHFLGAKLLKILNKIIFSLTPVEPTNCFNNAITVFGDTNYGNCQNQKVLFKIYSYVCEVFFDYPFLVNFGKIILYFLQKIECDAKLDFSSLSYQKLDKLKQEESKKRMN